MRALSPRGAAAPLLSLLLPLVVAAPAGALTFKFQKSFDVAAFGSSGSGTPRGLAVMGGSVLVNDALDDQIFVVDPSAETATSTYATNPFLCAPLAVCVPTQEWARIAWDLTFDGTNIWMVDKELSDGSITKLIRLNAAGQFIERFDITSSVQSPGGLTYDPRSGGRLLITDTGSDDVTFFDLTGTALGGSFLNSGGTGSSNPTGIEHFAGDLFLVSDPTDDEVHEFLIPSGGGTPTRLGAATFVDTDLSPYSLAAHVGSLQSVAYDPTTGTLYLVDDLSDDVFVFALIPEPGTGALLALGLLGVAARRRCS